MSAKTIRDYKLVDAIRLINDQLFLNSNASYFLKNRTILNAPHTEEIFENIRFTDTAALVSFMRAGMGNCIGGVYGDREDYLRLCTYVYLALGKQDNTPVDPTGLAKLLTECVAGENFMTGNNFDDGEVNQEVIINGNDFYLIGKSCDGIVPEGAKPLIGITEVNRIPSLVQLWVDRDELLGEVHAKVSVVTDLLMQADENCDIPPVIECHRMLNRLSWTHLYALRDVLNGITNPSAERDDIDKFASALIELVYSDNQSRGITTLQGDILKAVQANLEETLYGKSTIKPFKKTDDILSLLMPNGKDAELTLEEDIIMASVYETLAKHPNIIKRLATYKEIEEGKQPPV